MKDQKQAVLLLYINPENPEEVLSVSRKDDHSKLGLPGGKADEEETFINALIREINEELGITIDRTKLEFLYQNWDHDYDTSTYLYTGVLSLPSLPFINTEGAKVEFVSIKKLIKKKHSPFYEYNLEMFKKLSNLEFVTYLKHLS